MVVKTISIHLTLVKKNQQLKLNHHVRALQCHDGDGDDDDDDDDG